MSRAYRMCLTVEAFDRAKLYEIQEAAAELWPFGDWDHNKTNTWTRGDCDLCGGESVDQFVDRLAAAIFQANGAPCEVSVAPIYLEGDCLITRGPADAERLAPLAPQTEEEE